eukprot:257286_1
MYASQTVNIIKESTIQLEAQESNIDTKNQTDAKSTEEETKFNLESHANELEIVEKERELTTKLHRHPSIIDVINKKVTWTEFFEIYNVLRIGIAAIIAILTVLFVFCIVYIINPNKCRVKRENSEKIEWSPIANKIQICLELILMFGPVVKIFGYEWKWSSKKSNISFLVMCVIIFIVFMPYAFIYNMNNGIYSGIAISIFVFIIVIYLFAANGFYVFWMILPFVFAFIIGSICVLISAIIFRNFLKPDSFFFGSAYSLFLTVLQFAIFKFNLYSFAYKYGQCFTCPCNRGKTRSIAHDSVTVESELSDMIIFWYSMVVIGTVETFRIAEYIELLEQRGGWGGLYQFVACTIVFEIITRNGILWEILYKCFSKPVPGRTRVMSIYFAAKYQAEWIPIWCALLMNGFGYGPFQSCMHVRDIQLSNTLNVNGEWWLFGLMFGVEIVQAIGSFLMLWIARYFKLYGMKNEEGQDPPRAIILVKVNLIPMIWILVQCYIFSYESFIVDKNTRAITV